MKMSDLGFDSWFKGHARELCGSNYSVARVITVDRGRYSVKNESGESSAILMGKFLHTTKASIDFPCVGDWVCLQHHDPDNFLSIHDVLPRRTLLRRKNAGKDVEFQMIAANVDVALIVQSCHFDFNVRRLERYLVMVNEAHIEPLVLLTKTDLVSPDELDVLITKIRNAGIDSRIIAISNTTGSGIDQIRKVMVPGKTYCLLGSSGTGKTTLINNLTGHSELETKTVSGTGEGRHTTTRRQIIMLEQGAILIDTPGMRELGILSAEEGIDDSFSDILERSTNCRFTDCSHTNEPGCAILAAIENGALDQGHYRNYLKIKKESEFYQMSSADKRKKDKDFGRLIQFTKKHKH